LTTGGRRRFLPDPSWDGYDRMDDGEKKGEGCISPELGAYPTLMRDEIPPKASALERSEPRLLRWKVLVPVIFSLAFLLVVFWVKRNLYASKFIPVQMVASEQAVLDRKLSYLEGEGKEPRAGGPNPGMPLPPEPYSEVGIRREIFLTERELNALVAGDLQMAERVAIDLSDDLISVKLAVPVDEQVPVLGGKTLRFHMGMEVRYERNRPHIALKGVSLGGIPLPNAWLGYLKNVNLVEAFGTEQGFWKIFAAGVRTIRVTRGGLRITLKE